MFPLLVTVKKSLAVVSKKKQTLKTRMRMGIVTDRERKMRKRMQTLI